MPSTALLKALPLALATLMGVAPASIAATTLAQHRHVISHRDARHDVLLDGPENSSRLAPRRANGDITRIRIRYAAHNLRIHVSFAQLRKPRPRTSDDAFFEFDVETSRSIYFATGLVTAKHPRGQWEFSDGDTFCRGGHTLNYARARMSITIPAHCMGSPRWARVAFGELLRRHHSETYDSAFSKGSEATRFGIHESSRVYRE